LRIIILMELKGKVKKITNLRMCQQMSIGDEI
jgi:hypothetical protein